MKIDRIAYSESHESVMMGLKRWHKYGVEAQLEEGDNEFDSMMELKRKVSVLHEQDKGAVVSINPEYANHFIVPPALSSVGQIKHIEAERTEIAIDNATSIEQLDLLMGDAAKYGLAKELNERKRKLNETA